MSTLLSCATGNWLTASTWALVDSTSYLNSENTVTSLTTSYIESQSFTPGAITIDGIAVKLGTRLGTTGTVSIRLAQGGSLVADTEVTIDAADFNAASHTSSNEGGWYFFKFSVPVLLVAATAYTVSAKSSTNSQIQLYRDSTAGNWSRMLRTTTTQAPVAGDDLVVAGEHTGQGTGNDITVTMNETANTDYGASTTSGVTPALAVCKRGRLKFNDASAGNPYLRLSGWCVVYNGGTFDIGTTGTPIPRDSVTVLEFDPAADGDRGFQGRNGSTVNLQGLSRTSGKNVNRCLLTADAPSVVNTIEGIANGQTGGTSTALTTQLDPSGTSPCAYFSSTARAGAFTDNTSNSTHYTIRTGTASVAGGTTQTMSVWLRRGTGTNNRYVRMVVGTNADVAPSNGFYADVDLQAGTIGTCTAIGTGTAIASSITAVGDGYLCTITGTARSTTSTPSLAIGSCNSLGGTTYVGDTTQCFHHYGLALYTASSPPLTLSVSADTGWLDGDVVAIASTTRTASDCEPMQLSANAGASSFDTKLPPVVAHSGTSPTQAEVILLTRNVKVRSVSNTLMSFFNIKAGCAFDADWAEFYYLGENVTDKHGGLDLELNTTASANFNVQNCSIHDCEDQGVYFNVLGPSASVTAAVFNSNVLWNCATVTGPAVFFSSGLTASNWEMDNNIVMRTQSSNCFTLNDLGGKFTNNTAIGASSIGMSLQEANARFGNFGGLTAHSCSTNPFSFSSGAMSGVVDGCTAWRNGAGLAITATISDLTIDDYVAFGNSTSNININAACTLTFNAPVSNGDTSFTTNSGITVGVNGIPINLNINDGDFSTVGGIKTAHGTDLAVGGSTTPDWRALLRNTKLGAATEVSTQSSMAPASFVSSQRHDQTAGNHKTWTRGGVLSTDTAIYNTASPSLRMTVGSGIFATPTLTATSGSPDFTLPSVPSLGLVGAWLYQATAFPNGARVIAYDTQTNVYTADVNASASVTAGSSSLLWPLESAPFSKGIRVPVADGQTVDISVYTRCSAAGDGTAYVGLQPRLILKANPALGVSGDTVLDTHSAAAGSWEQLTGTTPAATDDGAFEFVIDCGGTTGWVNVDDWAVT